jgi:hypothetical protein
MFIGARVTFELTPMGAGNGGCMVNYKGSIRRILFIPQPFNLIKHFIYIAFFLNWIYEFIFQNIEKLRFKRFAAPERMHVGSGNVLCGRGF